MSSVKTQSRYDASRHMNFISTAPYNTAFWTYTYTGPSPSNSFTGVGALSLVTRLDGTATNATTDCPAGRILRANGKKLYLDAAAVPALAPWNDRTPLVGVFDYSTGLSGFIDPNQTMFALYNVDKPVDATDEESSKGRNTHKGMSVYTGGNVISGGQLALNGGTKAITYAATTSPYAFGTTANLSPFYSFAAAAGVTITATSVPPTGTTLTVFYSGAVTILVGSGFVGASVAPTGTQCIAVSYVSNGTVLIEYARSGALATVPTFPAAPA